MKNTTRILVYEVEVRPQPRQDLENNIKISTVSKKWTITLSFKQDIVLQ